MARFTQGLLSIVLLIGILLIGVACSKHSSELRDDPFATLVGAGPLPLSVANPYLGSNLYIAEEAAKSSYLYSFLDRRGGPAALKIEDDSDSRTMTLFYIRERIVYVAEKSIPSLSDEWLVRGPYSMTRKDYLEVSRLGASQKEPVFILQGKTRRFGERIIEPSAKPLTPSITVVPKATPKPKPKPKATVISKVGPTPAPTVPSLPMNSDQRALEESKKFAERNASGDLIHVVGEGAETLGGVVTWYTGSTEGEAEVAKVNGLEAGAPLKKGAKIIIPGKFVRNPVRKE